VATLAPRDLWPVLGNATQLHQVLLNLSVNARDAMPDGGELTLAADNVNLTAAEAGEIPGASPGPFVMLLVADTGTGIAPDVLPRLFEPFFTTKAAGKGTGLGLSSTAHIVRSHGGFVQVKSEVGVGTTFDIYLPRAVASPAAAEPADSAELPGGQGELILLIDDDQAFRDIVGATLRDHGYRVLVASSGVAALSLLARHGDEIRLVLTDLDMPEMDGLATMAAIRRERATLPVVLMSGTAPPGSNLGSEPATTCLAKPFRLEQLLQILRERLPVRGGEQRA
jgi:two-component system, cell cycle sensor histidine kinase and response regulator CckA